MSLDRDGETSSKITPFKQDSFHFYGSEKINFKALMNNVGYRYVFYLRQCQAGGWRKAVFSVPRKHLSLLRGLEISPEAVVGGGCTLAIPMGLPSIAERCSV